jgi:hypothetical protein
MNITDIIDVTKPMSWNEFYCLFAQLHLTVDEEISLKNEWFVIYELFIKNDVVPETAWIATRNMFVIKNQQIAERLKKEV